MKRPTMPDAGQTRLTSVQATDPKELWQKFISQRKPVVIEGLLTEEAWQGLTWTDSHLTAAAVMKPRSVAVRMFVTVTVSSQRREGKGKSVQHIYECCMI